MALNTCINYSHRGTHFFFQLSFFEKIIRKSHIKINHKYVDIYCQDLMILEPLIVVKKKSKGNSRQHMYMDSDSTNIAENTDSNRYNFIVPIRKMSQYSFITSSTSELG